MRDVFGDSIFPIPEDKNIQLPGDFDYFSRLLEQEELKTAAIIERVQSLLPCEHGSVISQEKQLGILERIQYWSTIANERRGNKNVSFLLVNLPDHDSVTPILRNTATRSGIKMINVPLPDSSEIEETIDCHERAGKIVLVNGTSQKDAARFLHSYNLRTILGWLNELSENHKELTIKNLKGLINPCKNVWIEILEQRESILKKIQGEIIGQEDVNDSLKKVFEGIFDRLTLEQKIVSKGDQSPLGYLFFAGPTGVGKTEVVRIFAREIEGKKIPFRKIQMTEYRESHSISRFIGAPPGYVGYGKGELGNFIFANQHRGALLLFDEFEKAHPRVQTIFLTMLEGSMTTGDGEKLDLSNCFMVFTSNAGAIELKDSLSQFDKDQVVKENRGIIKNALMKAGAPIELIGRFMTAIMPFNYITEDEAKQIIEKNLQKIQVEFRDTRNIRLVFDFSIQRYLVDIFRENKELGARNMVNHINGLRQNLSVLAKEMKEATDVCMLKAIKKHLFPQ